MKTLIIILISLFCFTGCNRITEVDEKSFVTAIGFDKGDKYNSRFTFVFTSPSKDSDKTSGGEEDETIVIEAPSIYSAIEQINNFKSKSIELTHTQTLIFSEELAREGLTDYIYMLVRSNHFRPNTYVCIADDSAMEFLEKINPVQTYHLEKYFQMIFNKMTSGEKGDLYLYDSYFRLLSESEASVLPYCALNDIKFLEKEEEPTQSPSEEPSQKEEEEETIPSHFMENTDDFAINTAAGKTVTASDNPAEIQGVAVIKEGKYVCMLGRIESTSLQLITNSFPDTYISFSNPQAPQTMITCYMTQKKKTKIKVECAESPVISVDICIEGDFAEVGEYSDCIKDPTTFEKYMEEKFKESITVFLEKISKELNCDICGFSEAAKSNFSTVDKWQAYNWKEKFQNAKFNVNVDVTMRTYGELSQKSR